MERLKKRTNLSKAFPVLRFEKFGLQGIIVGFGGDIDGTLKTKGHLNHGVPTIPPGPIVKWDHPSSFFFERLYSTRRAPNKRYDIMQFPKRAYPPNCASSPRLILDMSPLVFSVICSKLLRVDYILKQKGLDGQVDCMANATNTLKDR